MVKLKNINGHFVESDYENALITFLEREGWQYLYGDSISRANRKEVIYMDDLKRFYPRNMLPKDIVADILNLLNKRQKSKIRIGGDRDER